MSKTAFAASFAGKARVFDLRIGEIEELENLCGAGIGAIFSRLATLQFRLADVRETIRLGLIGGGMPASEATFFVKRYVDREPINENIQLAADILRALFDGVKDATKDDPPGEPARSDSPATSAPSSQPDSSPASAPTASAA